MQRPITLTVEEVAAILRLSTVTIYRELVKKRLPGFKVGNQWRVRHDILDEWIEEQSGWTNRFDRLWMSFQKRGKARRITEEVVAQEIKAARKSSH